jgi:hypothetical protein
MMGMISRMQKMPVRLLSIGTILGSQFRNSIIFFSDSRGLYG